MIRIPGIVALCALFSLACSEVLNQDISVSYPFGDEPEEYTISIDQAMENLNTAILQQTDTLVTLKADTSAFPDGSDISVDATLSLDDLLKLISGKPVTLTVTLTATHPQLPTVTDTQSLAFSICDFVTDDAKKSGVKTTFEFEDVHMEIMNLDTYCPAMTGVNPYLLITHRNEPKPIVLSENEDMKEYRSLLKKIRSATLDDLRLVISEYPEGFHFGDAGADAGDTVMTMQASLLAQPVADCTGSGDTLKCTGIDFSEEQNPADIFENADLFWIGDFGNSELTEGGELKLIYTYDGKNILQDSIMHLDFQIGIKSQYTIRPGADRPTGVLKASISATFFFNVEPLK